MQIENVISPSKMSTISRKHLCIHHKSNPSIYTTGMFNHVHVHEHLTTLEEEVIAKSCSKKEVDWI